MVYVKRSAQVLLVDESEIEKYKQNGFEEFVLPELEQTPEPEATGAKDGKISK